MSHNAREARPNILLVVAEDMGPQLGIYGDPDARSPHLNRFGEESLRFSRAWCAYPVCSPGRASLLTGLPAHENGTMGLATFRFTTFDGVPSLPRLLEAKGYRTGLLGKLHVLPEERFRFNLRWSDGARFSFSGRDYPKMLRYAEEFMNDDSRPFFLMVALPDAHVPFLRQTFGDPPEPRAAGDVGVVPGMDQRVAEWEEWYAGYHNCIRRVDSAFGGLREILDRRGLSENTLVIFTSDHGLQFPRGKLSVYEPGLSIPLLVGGAGVEGRGKEVDTPVMQVDVFATILAAAGVPLPSPVRGRSLIDLAASVPEDRCIFAERTACTPSVYFPQRAVRNRRYKLIRSFLPGREDPYYRMLLDRSSSAREGAPPIDRPPIPPLERLSPAMRRAYATWQSPPEYQFYDLQQDSLETLNRAGDTQLALEEAAMRGHLDAWMRETDDFVLDADRRRRFEIEIEHYPGSSRQARELSRDFEWDYVRTSRPRTLG
jgi:N-sulfoglucosamine sulfohydrolase